MSSLRHELAEEIAACDQPATHPGIRLIDLPVQFDEQYCNDDYLSDVLQNRFSFNGETHALASHLDWLDNPSQDIEWHILLHKFYYAPGLARRYAHSGDARYLEGLFSLIDGWIESTPVGFIAVDVTARRMQNWLYAWYLLEKYKPGTVPEPMARRMLESLCRQCDYVLENLAPARNHRTLELYAVFLMSLLFPDEDVQGAWRTTTVREMTGNILSDLRRDGVHCEQSTDYHHIVLRSYLLFVRLAGTAGVELPESVHERIQAALDFSMHLHRPDGLIPALSDSDSKDYRYLLAWSAERYGRRDHLFVATSGLSGEAPLAQHRVFDQSGHAFLRSAWRSDEPFADARYLVFDAGPVGDGNHGHLDALSIELSGFGRPLVVDPGRYTYDEKGDINWRARFRGTAAHNTVTVDGSDQAIYRQGPTRRKVRLPHPQASLVDRALSGTVPYLHGKVTSPCYAAVHHRHIWFIQERYWVVLDRLQSTSLHRYQQRWQLTPDAQDTVCVSRGAGTASVASARLTMLVAQPDIDIGIEPSFVSRDYGIRHSAPQVVCSARATSTSFVTLVYPENDCASRLQAFSSGRTSEFDVEDDQRRHRWSWNPQRQCLSLHDGWQTIPLMKGGHHVSA